MEVFIFVLVGWIFSVCLHEFGHAIVAYEFGDRSVKEKGYLTMNPIHYTHPVMSFALPILFMLMGGIGLPGGAVYIDDSMIRGKWRRAAVSLAGPAMNLLLTLLLCVPFWTGLVTSETRNLVPTALALLISLQISAVLFNLLPVPSLDGFRALSEWLPQDVREFSLQYGNMFMFLLFGLFWRVPALSKAFWFAVYLICHLLGIDPYLVDNGWDEFRFWEHRE
jgi:Zn-dependent protease